MKIMKSTCYLQPRNLLQLETESLKLRTSERMFEGEFKQGDRPGSVRIEIKPVQPGGLGEDLTDEDLDSEADSYHNKEENWPPAKNYRQDFKPLMDPEVVKEFLLGDYCLYGGSGWWKYEFCYGNSLYI